MTAGDLKSTMAPRDQSANADQASNDSSDLKSEPPQDGVKALQTDDVLESPKPEWHVAPSAVDFEDPLIQCVSMLATLLQRPISTEALKAGLPHAEQRFTPDLAVRAAERAGLTARVVRRPKLKSIQEVTLPCILLLKGSGACVLTKVIDRKTVEVMIPEGGGGSKVIGIEELEEQYLGYALFARPEFKFDERASDIRLKKPTAWFWGTLAKFWPIYSHVALASVMINVFAIASPSSL